MSSHGVEQKFSGKASAPAYTDEVSTDGVTSVGMDVSRDVLERHKLGSPDVQELKAGIKHANISIDGDWNEADFSAIGERLEEAVQNGSSNDFALFPDGDAVPKIQLDDVMLESFSIQSNLTDLLKYSARGKGKSMTITPA